MEISDEWLLQLWSGTVGAALSAVLAAFVAVGVVWWTNKVQRKIASDVKTATAEQVREQMAQNERHAAEQLSLARKQLDEQRKEASKAREVAAIADLVSLTAVGRDIQREEAFFLQYEQDVLAAVARWQLELDETSSMRTEIPEWTPFLVNLARASHHAGLRVDPDSLEVDSNSDLARRQDLVKNFSDLLIRWHRATTFEEKEKVVGILKRVRTAGSGPLDNDPIFAGWL
ncbi:hypothetical protein ACFVVC_01820 [Pseudarthrobacter sp. NPDC058196]|uniref:hypothetical protein n=1 Tax=Pseudarthrobacter sp. NPDC058196 TaxID=3346376 RepID=UPI0036DBAC1E